MPDRLDLTFPSGNTQCAAWLCLPDDASSGRPAPVVVMGHGLGGTRALRLAAFADRFVAAGYACLVFDYRHFGDSGGEPRQLLDIGLQLGGLGRPRSNSHAGTGPRPRSGSCSGEGPSAVATSSPPLPVTTASLRPSHSVRSPTDSPRHSRPAPVARRSWLRSGLRDAIGAQFGRQPVMVPVVGPPGSVALMATPDAESGYLALAPQSGTAQVAAPDRARHRRIPALAAAPRR